MTETNGSSVCKNTKLAKTSLNIERIEWNFEMSLLARRKPLGPLTTY